MKKKLLLLKQSVAGFTLLETMIVIVIAGILAAIMTPSWISFINQRKVNVVNDAILSALQDAQQEAKKNNLSYSVTFITETTTKLPRFFVYPVNTPPPSSTDKWPSLVQDLGLQSGQPVPVIIGTNLTSENTASSSPPSYASITAKTITFDYQGNLKADATLGSNGLIITVAIPQAANSTQPIISTMRCVKVMTLLGTLQTGREDKCNAS